MAEGVKEGDVVSSPEQKQDVLEMVTAMLAQMRTERSTQARELSTAAREMSTHVLEMREHQVTQPTATQGRCASRPGNREGGCRATGQGDV